MSQLARVHLGRERADEPALEDDERDDRGAREAVSVEQRLVVDGGDHPGDGELLRAASRRRVVRQGVQSA